MLIPSDSEDDSQSILTQGTLEGHLAGESDGEGEEASQAKHKRARPTATVTSGATLSEHKDEGQEEGLPPPKKSSVSNSLLAAQEQKLVDFFASNPMFYDQTLREFKDKTKRDHLLGVIGNDIGLTCKCKFLINIFSTL